MHLHVLHRTTFIYPGPAHDSFNEARLRPVDDDFQTCQRFALRLDPEVPARDYRDFYDNTVHYFDIGAAHQKLVVEATSEVETVPNATRVAVVDAPLPADASDFSLQLEFLNASPFVPDAVELWREAQDVLASGRTTVFADAVRLAQHVYRTFTYQPRATDAGTIATAALAARTGVCQDYAHVTLGLCRNAGIPARYASGYFFNDQRKPHQPEASHAWIEVYVPGHGWAGYDPTHDRAPDERYVKIATGRDYDDIRPIRGTYRGLPGRDMKVDVAVTRVDAAVAARA
jgi:transglutaminase-like putative cysteine protease